MSLVTAGQKGEARPVAFWPEKLAALGLALGLSFSWVLWTNIGRTFPVAGLLQTPLSPGLDQALFCLAIVSCMAIFIGKLTSAFRIILFASLSGLIALDLNRFQPWVYEYGVIIFLCSLVGEDLKSLNTEGDERKLKAVSILLIAIYFFSGLQKLNWRFFTGVTPWLLGMSQTAAVTFTHDPSLMVASLIVALAEVSLALALAFAKTRKPGVVMALIMHGTIIALFLQKFADNRAVWPWNITQVALILACFWKHANLSLFTLTWRKMPLTIITLLTVCFVIPVAGLLQIADPYPAFAFYTGDIPTGFLLMKKETVDLLPQSVQRVCFYDEHNELWCIDFVDWAYVETGAANYPSKFCMKLAAQKFAHDHPGALVVLKIFTFPKLTDQRKTYYEKISAPAPISSP